MAEKKNSSTDDAGQAEVQAKFDEAAEKGYFGTSPDETPPENYTLQGVTSGKPTPETERTK
ncbi:MAG: hypothetical protein H0X12_04945 [Nocardioides sp.]|nr:hypothetical protein [Nocardioides sp.]